jgi:hypothetical protein
MFQPCQGFFIDRAATIHDRVETKNSLSERTMRSWNMADDISGDFHVFRSTMSRENESSKSSGSLGCIFPFAQLLWQTKDSIIGKRGEIVSEFSKVSLAVIVVLRFELSEVHLGRFGGVHTRTVSCPFH